MENDKEQASSACAKISISSEAEAALDRMVRAANEGFLGGRITKHQLASWVLGHFAEHSFEQRKAKIQEAHFDRTAFLTGITERMRAASRKGESTAELEAELLRVLGGGAAGRPARGRPAKVRVDN